MIIIEKALGKDNIDEVVTLSRDFREREGCQSKTYMEFYTTDASQQALYT
jgi:hypothetical protein